MTTAVDENYTADTSADDFLTADEPPEADVSADGEAAPYGWTRDRITGEMRPKKRPGRPSAPPGPDEILTAPPVAHAADRPPGPGNRRGGPVLDADVPMPKAGYIAAGVNKAYRRAGKIIRVFDAEMGEAFIACTRREDGDDADELTVGEGWENLCRVNPRVRRFVTRAIASGAIGELVMAHAPIAIAFMMKPLVRKLIPFERLIGSMAEPDEDTPEGEGDLPGGMTAADFAGMQHLAEEQARHMAAKMGMHVSDEDLAAASAQAAGQMPAAFRRQQPRSQSRAKRAHR